MELHDLAEDLFGPPEGGVGRPVAEDPSRLSPEPGRYLYQPLLSENQIRLLLLKRLAPSSTQDSQPICATLHHVEFDSESLNSRLYRALSYEWEIREQNQRYKGETKEEYEQRLHEKQAEAQPGATKMQSEEKPTIVLDGYTLTIGENLYNALRSIRNLDIYGDETPSLWLWVDALCINQNDVQERGHQVRLMKRIYETAEMVLVWLGTGDGWTHAAMEAMNMEPGAFEDHVSREALGYSVLRGIRQLCEMGYWRRVWILQEVVLARNYVVICNQDFVSMDNFERALGVLCQDVWNVSRDTRNCVLWLPESPANEIIAWRKSKGKSSPLAGWVRICVRCYFKATEPRDYVYALLGISDDCEGWIVPDYTLSVTEVYSLAIRLIFNEAGWYNESLGGTFAALMGLKWETGRRVWEEMCIQKEGGKEPTMETPGTFGLSLFSAADCKR